MVFLVGAWAAVTSSLLGVWQAVPYIFADTWHRVRKRDGSASTRDRSYRAYLLVLAVIPLVQVAAPLREVQKYYAVLGACFIPALAVLLLVLNRRAVVGAHRNRAFTIVVLIVSVVFFLLAGWLQVRRVWP